MNVNQTLKDYELNNLDLICISTYLHTDSKVYAWKETIGKASKSKYPESLSSRWFQQPKIVKYLFDVESKAKIRSEANELIRGKDKVTIDSTQTKQTLNRNSNTITDLSNLDSITSDNIKEKLETELRYVSDPKDRAVILMKIAEFIGVNKTDIDLTTPTIYLPQRCSNCEYKKIGGEG